MIALVGSDIALDAANRAVERSIREARKALAERRWDAAEARLAAWLAARPASPRLTSSVRGWRFGRERPDQAIEGPGACP